MRFKVEKSTEALQLDPHSIVWQHELAAVSERLQGFERRKAEGQRLRSRLKWKSVGDQCSKEFFQTHKARSNASQIIELRDTHGQSHTS